MNEAQANAIRDRIRLEGKDIRVLCLRGHFIAHVALYVDGDSPTAPIRMHPRGPDKRYVGDIDAGHHGFTMDVQGPSYNVRLTCPRCTYSGSFNFILLGLELAAAALAGKPEYPMTT